MALGEPRPHARFQERLSDLAAASVCAQQAPATLGFPGALPQRRVVWMWFGSLVNELVIYKRGMFSFNFPNKNSYVLVVAIGRRK